MNLLCKLHLHKFRYKYFKEYFNNEHFREYSNRGGFRQWTYRSCVKCGLIQFTIGPSYYGCWVNINSYPEKDDRRYEEFDGEYTKYDEIPIV